MLLLPEYARVGNTVDCLWRAGCYRWGMKLTYYGHSACLLETQSHRLLFDPFLSGNALCPVDPQSVRCDYILLTHGHADHIGDTGLIAKNNDATVIATFELAEYVARKWGVKVHPMNIGGGYTFPFGRVRMTQAFHSSSCPGDDGETVYLGQPGGFMVYADHRCIYHAGDTALFGDMQMMGDTTSIDLALLPIGDNFTMGPNEAMKAMEWLRPRAVLPIHYNTFPLIKQDVFAFADRVSQRGVGAYPLQPGESVEL